MGIGMKELLILILVGGFFWLILYPYIRIFRKAGYTGWLAVLVWIPLVNLVLLWWFAFADWPALSGPRA